MDITIDDTIVRLTDKANLLKRLTHLDDAQYEYYQEQIAYCEQIVAWLNKLKSYEIKEK